jgi:hypothetical protein
MDEAFVAIDGFDHTHQPIVGKARHELDVTGRQLVSNALCHIRRIVIHGVFPAFKVGSQW